MTYIIRQNLWNLLSLHLRLQDLALEFESEPEARTCFGTRCKGNLAIEQLNDFLRDHESQSNSVDIQIAIIFKEAKKLK